MEHYLDNSATTQVLRPVAERALELMVEEYGNPSSLYRKGVEAEHYIRDAKETIAKLLKVNAKELFFTSGGTESDNLALIGCARANRRRGNHLITSSIEHPAILNTMRYLEEEEGFRVTYLPVDGEGRIRLDALKEALCPETILVSIMYVNNELGTVQPVQEAARMVKQYKPSILFHTDAVQGYGKYRIWPKRMGIDLLTASGHKIHGPKGVGFLYIDSRVKIHPIVFGGEQQRNIRSGTENVPGIAGMGKAAELIYAGHKEKTERIREVRDHFRQRVMAEIPDVEDHSGEAPHIASITFLGVRSEVLLHALEEKGVYVSAGSACSSNKPEVSGTLKGIGLEKNEYESTLRFSFSVYNTVEETDVCVDVLKELLPVLRRFTRR